MPIRTCVACRRRAEKRDLLRWVVDDCDIAVADPRARLPGRGAYVCRTEDCWKALGKRFRRRGIDFETGAAAFRLAIPGDVIQNVRRETQGN